MPLPTKSLNCGGFAVGSYAFRGILYTVGIENSFRLVKCLMLNQIFNADYTPEDRSLSELFGDISNGYAVILLAILPETIIG